MNTLSKTEQIVLRLIKQDLLYLFTVHRNISTIGASYLVALFSYIGLIIDGCEDWINKVNALKNDALKFSTEESQYYSDLRNSIKLWEMQFTDLYRMINMKYCESENHFANCCKPIAKNLQLYDIFGTYIINGKYCDNTILDMLFAPGYKLGNENGDYIRKMAEFAGKTMASFAVNKNNTYEINHTFTFTTKDFGGFENHLLEIHSIQSLFYSQYFAPSILLFLALKNSLCRKYQRN